VRRKKNTRAPLEGASSKRAPVGFAVWRKSFLDAIRQPTAWKAPEPPLTVTVRRERWEEFIRWERSNKSGPGRPTEPKTATRIKTVAFWLHLAHGDENRERSFLRPLPLQEPFWPQLPDKEARNRFCTFIVKNGDKIKKARRELSYPYYLSD
jgi:hypothetical protein